MFSSLFGDLRSVRNIRTEGRVADDDAGFAATAIMESTATEVNDHGHMVDNHVQDIVVTGSPAQAIRDHFASTRADLGVANRQITLLDPTSLWASSVVKALSDASGRPIERIHLREQGTLRTLAMIERTLLERRNEDTLRIYHADVRAPGLENAAIPVALMERSHMTAVIVGAMSPHAIDGMLMSLQQAVGQPNWRCPTLLFMLPPNAVWIANKIAMYQWPADLRVQVLNESLSSASAVWNSLLNIWNRVKTVPTWQPAQVRNDNHLGGFQIRVADLGAPSAVPITPQSVATTDTATAPEASRVPLAPEAADRAVAAMIGIDGLLGCAVVDAATGFALAHHSGEGQPQQLEMAAAGGAQILRAHQQAARSIGMADDIEEIMTSAGNRHHVLRTVSHHKGLFLFALLDKQHTNLALARYKLMEAEHGLS